eukprot:g23768.t1
MSTKYQGYSNPYASPTSAGLDGLRAAAARRAIIGEMSPLLAVIFSMMVVAAAGDRGIVLLDPETTCEGDSVGKVGTLEEMVDIRLAAVTGRVMETLLGMIGKKGPVLERPALESAKATGMGLASVCGSIVDTLVTGMTLLVGL